MKTLKLLPFLLGTIMLFTYCAKDEIELKRPGASDNPAVGQKDAHIPVGDECTIVQPLYAGAGQNDLDKGTEVGYITAEIDNTTLHVTYYTTGGWTMTETHLWVGSHYLDIPKKAAPGQFPYKDDGLEYVTEHSYTVDLGAMGIGPDETVYVAAHAVVKGVEYSNIDEVLPQTAEVFVKYYNHDPTFGDSYFLIDLSEAGFLNGEYYQGWCLDLGVPMEFGEDYNPYTAYVYSSYGILPEGLVSNPDHLPAINWLLNQDLEGYSIQDIQVAIWVLMEGEGEDHFADNDERLGVVGFDWENVQLLVGYATEHLDFMPGCGEYIGIILVNDDQQTAIIKVPVPCKEEGSETAWAYGDYPFDEYDISKKWGWLFQVDLGACNID